MSVPTASAAQRLSWAPKSILWICPHAARHYEAVITILILQTRKRGWEEATRLELGVAGKGHSVGRRGRDELPEHICLCELGVLARWSPRPARALLPGWAGCLPLFTPWPLHGPGSSSIPHFCGGFAVIQEGFRASQETPDLSVNLLRRDKTQKSCFRKYSSLLWGQSKATSFQSVRWDIWPIMWRAEKDPVTPNTCPANPETHYLAGQACVSFVSSVPSTIH